MSISLLVSRCQRWLASRTAFRVILGLLVLQATWIALLGRFPMAFDEDFHLGIIKLYAAHGLPFWSGQPAHADAYGAIARDPSYLFHYLMSFPYRVLAAFTDDLKLQVLGLRAINIGLFALGLVLWRRLLLTVGASRAVAHGCLLLFILIPAVPLLAAQINYDNLLLPLVAGLLLLAVRFTRELKPTDPLDLRLVVSMACLAMLGGIVKYAFLPILLGVVGYLLFKLWRTFGWRWRQLGTAIRGGWRLQSPGWKIGLVAAFVICFGLFFERYGVNMLRYHTPVPDCGQVLSVQQCSEYGPWIRDYNLENANTTDVGGPLGYLDDWLYGMWLRLFFAVDGPTTFFQTKGPLTLPGLSAIAFGTSTILVIAVQARNVYRRYDRSVLQLFGAVTICYIGVLYLDGFQRYSQTGQPVAINGRYLLPVLLMILVVGSLAWVELLRKRPQLKLAVFAPALICMLWGGGALTYVLRSNDAWYWPDAPVVKPLTHSVQRVLGPVVPGYDHPTQYLR